MLQKTLALTERALRVDSRSRVSHVIRLVVALVVMLLFPIGIFAQAAAPGLQVFSMFTMGDAMLIYVVTPIYFGSCISDEKEERTLPLLMLADVSPLALISGKVLPQLLAIAVILLVQLPFTMLAITLGGIQIHQLLAAFLALASGVWLLAGVSTLCSVVCRQSSSAIGWAFGFQFLYYVVMILTGMIGEGLALNSSAAMYSQGFLDVASLLYDQTLFGRLNAISQSTFSEGSEMLLSGQFLTSMIVGTVSLLSAWLLFEPFNRNLDTEVVRQKAVRLTGESKRVWKWPLAWKEYHFVCKGQLEVILKCVLYGLMFVGFAFIGMVSGSSAYWGMLFSGYLVFWIMTLELQFRLATSFAFEAKDQTWSSLLTLPFSVDTLAWSKVVGLLLNMWPGFAILALCGLAGLIGADYSDMELPATGGSSQELILGLLAIPFFICLGLMYAFNYLQLIVLYATYIKNRWLALVAAFGTTYALNCVLYCLILIPFFLISEADMPVVVSIGIGCLYLGLGSGFTYLMYRQVIASIAAQVD